MDPMFRRLEERLKAVEGQNPLGVDVADLGLVPGVRVPPKFKVPIFDKYNGSSCPKTHVQAYFRKMVAYSDDEKLLMYFFQDSLAGASLEWYMRLDRAHIRCWRDLAEAFVKQYQYNADMAPNRTQLQNLSLKSNECFREYAQRWRETASRVQPPMLEKEMANMFMNTLPGPYLERLVGCNASNFADVVSTGERVENYLKTYKSQSGGGSSSGVKKSFIQGQKRREGDASAISSYQNRDNRRNNFQNYHQQPYVAVVTIPAATPLQQQQPQCQPAQYQPQQPGNRPAYQPRPRTMDRRFDTLPMSYAQLLSSLQQLQLVQLRTLAPPVGRLPVGYDANARCSFHSGAPGHNIENCKAFKHVVQDLIDSKAINLAPAPNVVNNPMPQHGGANINMMEGKAKSIKDVLKLKTPLLDIKGCLLKADVFPGCGKGCLDCATQSGGCLKLQQGIQALLDKGILQVEGLSVQESAEGVEEEGFEDATDEFADVVPTDSVIHDDVVADIPNMAFDSDVLAELDSDVSDVCTSTPQTRQGPITFSSAGIIQYGQVSAVNDEDGDSDYDIDNWVRPRIPGEVINNWSSEEIIQVTLLEE
jgi:hypothetical protein